MLAEGIGSVFDGIAGSRRLEGMAESSLGLGVQAAALGVMRENPWATSLPGAGWERPLSQWSAGGVGTFGQSLQDGYASVQGSPLGPLGARGRLASGPWDRGVASSWLRESGFSEGGSGDESRGDGSLSGTFASGMAPLVDMCGGSFLSCSPGGEDWACWTGGECPSDLSLSVQEAVERPYSPRTPSQARYAHHLTREASSYEIEAVSMSLETAVGALSSGALARLERLTKAVDPYRHANARDPRRWPRERRSGRYKLLLQNIIRAPLGARGQALRAVGLNGLRNALKRTRRARQAERGRLPDPPFRVPLCAAASTELTSAIMRHGPPVRRFSGKPAMPGVSVC